MPAIAAQRLLRRSRGRVPWSRLPLTALFVGAGILHFTTPETFEAIVPERLPAPRTLVHLSGIAEIAGGVGLLSRRTARAAGWWLIATLIAVFPANVGMALNPERHPGIPEALLWARLPLQPALVAWVYWVAVRRTAPVSL